MRVSKPTTGCLIRQPMHTDCLHLHFFPTDYRGGRRPRYATPCPVLLRRTQSVPRLNGKLLKEQLCSKITQICKLNIYKISCKVKDKDKWLFRGWCCQARGHFQIIAVRSSAANLDLAALPGQWNEQGYNHQSREYPQK